MEEIFHQKAPGKYLGDFIYGANDGIVTTFAVISGSIGASLSPFIVVILGLANLFADGFSMGASNFLSRRSNLDYYKGQKRKEIWEINNLPEIEVKEIRDVFSKWGFSGEDLDKAVKIIISDKKRWVNFMMVHELDIMEDQKNQPWKHGLATYSAFIIAGLVPLLPFLIPGVTQKPSVYSPIFAALTLFTVGALRSKITPKNWFIQGIEMLVVGSLAGLVAFLVGYLIKQIF